VPDAADGQLLRHRTCKACIFGAAGPLCIQRNDIDVKRQAQEENEMPSYVMLFHFTHEGLEHVKQSPDRVDKIKKVFRQSGGKVKDFYLMMGEYDSVFIAEAPDDETIARIALLIEAQGNVRSETHRAFSEAEFRKIVSGLP
jgi:uncharacterized protein with GYD domain